MKNVFTILALLITIVSFSQTKNLEGDVVIEDVKFQDLKVSVEVDSAEDIESTFKVEDIKELLNDADENQKLQFEIICKGEKMSNGVESSLSYKIEGNTNELKSFYKNVKKIRKAAINYYKNKE